MATAIIPQANTLTPEQMSEVINRLAQAQAVLDTLVLASDSNISESEGLRPCRIERAAQVAANLVKDVISTLINSEEEVAHG